MAWRVPTPMTNGYEVIRVEGSTLLDAQGKLGGMTRRTLAAVAVDVRAGLAETVGVGAVLEHGERSSIVIELTDLPAGIEPEYIARAIDMENVEAWCDDRNRIHVAIGPWYSTKDVDQVVLSITKVVHVLLGLHATDTRRVGEDSSAGIWRRLLTAATEITALQKSANRKSD